MFAQRSFLYALRCASRPAFDLRFRNHTCPAAHLCSHPLLPAAQPLSSPFQSKGMFFEDGHDCMPVRSTTGDICMCMPVGSKQLRCRRNHVGLLAGELSNSSVTFSPTQWPLRSPTSEPHPDVCSPSTQQNTRGNRRRSCTTDGTQTFLTYVASLCVMQSCHVN